MLIRFKTKTKLPAVMEKYNSDITILIISKDNALSNGMIELSENEGYSYISADSFEKAAELRDEIHRLEK